MLHVILDHHVSYLTLPLHYIHLPIGSSLTDVQCVCECSCTQIYSNIDCCTGISPHKEQPSSKQVKLEVDQTGQPESKGLQVLLEARSKVISIQAFLR